MKYVGGKHRIGGHIAAILARVPTHLVDGYLEPFVGSLGVFKHMANVPYRTLIASDYHKSLILMWKGIRNDTFVPPRSVSQTLFNKLKHNTTESPLKALVGFGASFGGDYFSGFIQKYKGSSNRDFYKETLHSIQNMRPSIKQKNVSFVHKSYKNWNVRNYLIYCDPPYCNTTGYSTGSFDHDQFWNTMRTWSKTNYVFVSEETAPSDFVSIWSLSKPRTLHPVKDKIFHRTEHLFVLRNSKAHKLIRKKSVM